MVTSHKSPVTLPQISESGAGFSLYGLVDDIDGPLAGERTAHFTRGPGLWVVGIGLVMLTRAAYEVFREPPGR